MREDLYARLIELNPDIKSLDVQPILNLSNETVGWNCFFMNQSHQAIAGGTARNIETAKRIAVAECFERSFFNNLFSNAKLFKELLLDESPSTSGFAAGFDLKSVFFRSTCEAVERWAWSKWIDSQFFMPERPKPNFELPLSQHIFSRFEDVRFFEKDFEINFGSGTPNILSFCVVLGFKGLGVFAGSRVTSKIDDPWEHALIEAHRNLNNFENNKLDISVDKNIIAQRARYFGRHSKEAISQIDAAKKILWPSPELRIRTEIETGIEGVFLVRSLCHDFIHWHLGDEKRFVY